MEDKNNYAFIDCQNIHQSTYYMGWLIDWQKFMIYLKEKYCISKAYIFAGYDSKYKSLYQKMRVAGYIIIFKPIIHIKDKTKGNIDADLVLETMIEINNFNKALIVSSDGDFYSLVRYLYSKDKLIGVLGSNNSRTSRLLKKEAKEKINFINNLESKISVDKNEKVPHKDETL